MTPLALFGVALGHVALWVEVVNRFHGLGWPRKFVDALTALCALAFFALPGYATWLAFQTGDLFAAAPTWLHWYAAACLAALAVVAATRAALRFDPHRHGATRPVETTRIDLAAPAGAVLTLGPVMSAAARLPRNELLRLHVEHRQLAFERLPAELDGLKVAHLTDLHMSGRLAIDYFHAVVRATNEWRPDLVCVTGDIVERLECCDWVAPTLGALRARLGSYFILGNHDEKADAQAVRAALLAAGLIDVGAEPAIVRGAGGSRLAIAGDERPWFRSPNIDATSGFTILLAHTPDRFASAARLGVDLVLSGHNHGGQVCLPWFGAILCPSRHGVRYVDGTFQRGRTVMHVGRGTGSLFPLRYNCPPELGLFTLRCATGSLA
ncbi:MAG: metallophosphoesterase [Lacipirellulaceae bacterium]